MSEELESTEGLHGEPKRARAAGRRHGLAQQRAGTTDQEEMRELEARRPKITASRRDKDVVPPRSLPDEPAAGTE